MSDLDQRLNSVEATQAQHAEMLEAHDSVLRSINKHLRELVGRLDRYDRKLMLLIGLLAADSKIGEALLRSVGLL